MSDKPLSFIEQHLGNDLVYYCPVCGIMSPGRSAHREHIQKAHIADPAKITELEQRIIALEAENERLKAGK